MVSQTCVLILTGAALVVGALLGVLWSGRQGHGAHAVYDPAFSVSAIIDQLEAESVDSSDELDGGGDDEDLSADDPERPYVVDVHLANHGPDDPALYRYHASAPRSLDAVDPNEETRPLPRPFPRQPNRVTMPPRWPSSEGQSEERTHGRHALHPPPAE